MVARIISNDRDSRSLDFGWTLTLIFRFVASGSNQTQNLSRTLDVIPACSARHVAFEICITSQTTVLISQQCTVCWPSWLPLTPCTLSAFSARFVQVAAVANEPSLLVLDTGRGVRKRSFTVNNVRGSKEGRHHRLTQLYLSQLWLLSNLTRGFLNTAVIMISSLAPSLRL
ncbi:hypothetical protein HYPSUDRAFT_860875 [Hypholoma sublateritium FD-334 SS-4]|uniref:Uncharacterized protein n=1 Tax=Hypholoma sublateritium (strain FD-334 SS-4) TaxID=945553 RepID=A0A0D2NSL5_HYPSF|nr:hypothetical protein HYPSUDRAFT_860875 [Hypholoma sublateritium FD-334 SS-4]